MIPAKPFYLVRHGETIANVARVTAGGGTDSPLTENGKDQARGLAALIHTLEITPSEIIHSPMSRARDTANFLNGALKLAMHEIDDLREHMVGEWEGWPWEKAMPLLRSNTRPKDGENLDDFGTRVRTAFNLLLSRPGKPPLVVAHGGIFHALLHIHDHPYDGAISNCHLHYFEPAPDANPSFPWRVWQFDADGHRLTRSGAPFCGTQTKAAAKRTG